MNYQRAQLKTQVKQTMRSTSPHPMLVALLFLIILWAGSWLINKVLGSLLIPSQLNNLAQRILDLVTRMDSGNVDPYYFQRYLENELEQLAAGLLAALPRTVAASMVISLASYLWASLMEVGYKGHCLSMVRGENPKIGRLFCAFPRIGSVLLTHILVGVFTFLWALLFAVILTVVCLLAVWLDMEMISIVLMLAASIAYGVALVWVILRYSLADYALLDMNLSGMEAIRASKTMMKGNTGKLFVLSLSFIGWGLLQFLILVVGLSVAFFIAGGAIAGMASSGNPSVGAVLGALGGGLVALIPAVIGCLVINLWLIPYVNGSSAKFYDYAKGQAPASVIPPAAPPTGPGPYSAYGGPAAPGSYGSPAAPGPYSASGSYYGAPTAPGAYSAPGTPAAPGAWGAPGTPAAPAAPGAWGASGTPAAPAAPSAYGAPAAPPEPSAPSAWGAPAAPTAPATSEGSEPSGTDATYSAPGVSADPSGHTDNR